MKYIIFLLSAALIFSTTVTGYSASDDDSDSGSSALGGAVMGGLLGAGLGAAIGSASGKAGTGAAIGGGVGALGGTLLAAEKAKKEKEAARYEKEYGSPGQEPARQASGDMKVKKRVIKEYDSQGNVVSEKEVAR